MQRISCLHSFYLVYILPAIERPLQGAAELVMPDVDGTAAHRAHSVFRNYCVHLTGHFLMVLGNALLEAQIDKRRRHGAPVQLKLAPESIF